MNRMVKASLCVVAGVALVGCEEWRGRGLTPGKDTSVQTSGEATQAPAPVRDKPIAGEQPMWRMSDGSPSTMPS